MKPELTPVQRTVLDRLLTKLAGSLDGAVDFWTLVCLGPLPTDRRGFLLEHCELTRALVLVAKSFLAEARLASTPEVHPLLVRLTASCQRLQAAFLALEQFRSVSLDELRSATETIAEVYNSMREAIRQLGDAIHLPVGYWQGRTPEREDYFRKILAGLFNQFRHERETGELAASMPGHP
jgi:hypothetical protein